MNNKLTDEKISNATLIRLILWADQHSSHYVAAALRELQERRKAEAEADPVGYIDTEYAELLKSGHIESCSAYAESGEGCIAVYAAPPAPVVDADDNFYSWFGREWHEHYQQNQYTTAAKQMLGVMAESAWKAGSRAAMLQGDEPVTTANKLPEGWVACSERMPERGVDVLACTISKIGGFEEIETAQWHGGMKGEQPVFITSADAIEPSHWMPLPAAPQQEA